MELERTILILTWIIGAALTAFLVVKMGSRRFIAAFLICQSIAWLNVMVHVQLGSVAYPVREFPKATDAGFTMQYMFYPVLCGLYLFYEPKGSRITRFLYLLGCGFGLALFHYGLAVYTQLLEYIHYHWTFVWLATVIIFGLTNVIVRWFFGQPGAVKGERLSHEP